MVLPCFALLFLSLKITEIAGHNPNPYPYYYPSVHSSTITMRIIIIKTIIIMIIMTIITCTENTKLTADTMIIIILVNGDTVGSINAQTGVYGMLDLDLVQCTTIGGENMKLATTCLGVDKRCQMEI
ncbi:uncharacterized protein LOC111716429 isoform X2 [Eurytemora carolleeae]|uniref:uncharacterized protein LOC111716429 isoform X2 n=1 Tax=Eurytemora carolleeae TaxID=1294199 RepID=UPI000C767E9B|nr:uncharacterized protein LOC111716429 isoform X2 [Eurytemora carolleeae]|eukprot:XP_023347652.1 uncharacterized protein LOC111716429 isoform X2 [Eurytemora affinis]